MTENSNRTFVCCVLFLDIIEYSKMSVTEQLSLKQRFNAFLVDALKDVVAKDRIVLDTGDGAAVSFLGNPEDSLFAAMALRDSLAAQDPKETPSLKVRIGLNLGPVRLVKDINGQLNIIGDGINVAQRVMSFAEPGSIMVSRSYFEVVARLSPDYEDIFQYDGTRTDKHVREHAVYVVCPAGGSNKVIAAEGEPLPSVADEGPAKAKAVAGKSNKKIMAAVAIAIAVIGAAVALRMARTKDAFETVEPKLAAASAEKKTAAESKLSPAPHSAPAPEPVVSSLSPASAASAAPAAPKAPSKIAVSLAIAPWGEVYVDGQMKGVSPPLKSLSLAPGKHKIEIRNTTFPSHIVEIDESAKDKIKIQHKF